MTTTVPLGTFILDDMRKEKQFHRTNYSYVRMTFLYFQEGFSEVALFFHDTHGGAYIAVLWKPKAFQPKPFKVCPKYKDDVVIFIKTSYYVDLITDCDLILAL